MADDPHLPSPGDVLASKYRIERLIGRGGMGAVFAAQHVLLNQRVAVKLLLGELAGSQEATARFMNEARAAAQIQGEHVARVLDIGQLPSGTPYMVLEYLEGSDLAGILHQRGTLTVPEVADFALQALDALAQAHAAGIVHRDLKPANLFLTRRHDGTSLVKVLDFGISKNLTPMGGTPGGMTQTRALLGSPEYMSPEQLRTPRAVDTRTDIWSLGVILYELLTGRMPFSGESVAELFVQILEMTPAPVRSIRPDVPAGLEAVIARCMSRDREARFANVRELASALMAFASDQTRAMAAARGSDPGLIAAVEPIPETLRMTAGGNTAAPWAHTESGAVAPLTSKRPRTAAMIAAGVVGLGIGCVGIAVIFHRVAGSTEPETKAVASQSVPALSAGAVATASAPLPAPSATIVAAPTGGTVHDAGPSLPPIVSPTSVQTVPRNNPPAPPRTSPPPSAASAPAGKNCNPNYFFDRDGNKHFKPECY